MTLKPRPNQNARASKQACFLVEMFIKLAALGVYGYCCQVSNVLDGAIVILGTVDYCQTPPEFLSGVTPHEAGVTSAFRCVRFFRVFKARRPARCMWLFVAVSCYLHPVLLTATLACLMPLSQLSREWKSMHELLDKFVATFWDVANVAFIFMLFAYVFTVLGMQLFANLLRFDRNGYAVRSWSVNLVPMSLFRVYFPVYT